MTSVAGRCGGGCRFTQSPHFPCFCLHLQMSSNGSASAGYMNQSYEGMEETASRCENQEKDELRPIDFGLSSPVLHRQLPTC